MSEALIEEAWQIGRPVFYKSEPGNIGKENKMAWEELKPVASKE